jgi:membrane protein
LEGPLWELTLSVAPLGATLLSGFLLFWFIFRVFPEVRLPTRVVMRGAAIGAVGITALLWAAGLLAGSFANNVAAAVFGGTLIIMLYFNLFATLILMVAAWMATDASMEPEPTPIELAERSAQGPTDYATKELVAIMRARQEQESAATVPRGSAVTAARVSGGVGAALGVAVAGGVAVVAALISGLLDRRR